MWRCKDCGETLTPSEIRAYGFYCSIDAIFRGIDSPVSHAEQAEAYIAWKNESDYQKLIDNPKGW